MKEPSANQQPNLADSGGETHRPTKNIRANRISRGHPRGTMRRFEAHIAQTAATAR
jgi:hypothetical protein